jgi:putative membrane protein
MRRFVSEDAKQALTAAIRSIETRSSAEVVIAIRHHSGSYLHADLLVGIAAVFATLAFVLGSRFEFSTLSIFVDPLLMGALCTLGATQAPMLRRWLTPARRRRQQVKIAAQSTFYEKGVRMTQGRTGILVYVSLLEQAVEVVLDGGVRQAVAMEPWDQAVARIERELRKTGDGVAVAKTIAALGEILATYLPRAGGDVNELPDEVCAP